MFFYKRIHFKNEAAVAILESKLKIISKFVSR